ncbi:MAG: hypothetical protein ACFFDB_19935 [Promethearchaeota archaeon]
MRDKRSIIIKNPKLIIARNSLRMVLMQAVNRRLIDLLHQEEKMEKNANGTYRSIKDFTPSELNQYRELQNWQSELRDIASRSICKCVACGKGDRDMVYNKAYDAWYCTSCYGMERDYAKASKKAKRHEGKAIESHSKTFL